MYPESTSVEWLFPQEKATFHDRTQGHAYSGSALGHTFSGFAVNLQFDQSSTKPKSNDGRSVPANPGSCASPCFWLCPPVTESRLSSQNPQPKLPQTSGMRLIVHSDGILARDS